jgi:ribosomal protein S14
MKKTELNIYNYIRQVKDWKKYELYTIIFKYFKQTKYVSKYLKFLIFLLKWKLTKQYFISIQTNVCKKNGNFKRTFDQIGLSRHVVRQMMNEGKLPHVKKLTW